MDIPGNLSSLMRLLSTSWQLIAAWAVHQLGQGHRWRLIFNAEISKHLIATLLHLPVQTYYLLQVLYPASNWYEWGHLSPYNPWFFWWWYLQDFLISLLKVMKPYPAKQCACCIVPPWPQMDIPNIWTRSIIFGWQPHSIYAACLLQLCQSSLLSPSLLPSTFYFWPIFASIWAEPPVSHIISSFTTASSITSVYQIPQPDTAVPIILEISCGR